MENINNIGITGIDSIRIGGMQVDNLPIAESASVKQQWPAIQKSDVENHIENIKAKYPEQSVAWIKGAIRDCESNLKNIRSLIVDQNKMITDYSGHISLCVHRDKELLKLDSKVDIEEIKELKLKFPPYNVKAMKTQIEQCKKAIFLSNGVIDKEHETIADLHKLMTQCIARDAELKPYGL